MRLMKPRLTAALCAVVVITVGLGAAATQRSESNAAALSATISTVSVERERLVDTVAVTGTLDRTRVWTVAHQSDPDLVETEVPVVQPPAAAVAETTPTAGRTAEPGAQPGQSAPTTTPPVETEIVITEVPAEHTVTKLPTVGTVVGNGDALYDFDGRPVIVLVGDAVAYRTLDTAAADGDDIAALEGALAALGYDPGTVDTDFDTATRGAVEAWQGDSGLEVTGAVALGSMVFAPDDLVVLSVNPLLGQKILDGSEVLSVGTVGLTLSFAIDPTVAELVGIGDTVTAQLPNRTAIEATVATLSPASAGGVLAKAVVLDSPAAVVTPLSVTIEHEVVVALDAMTVPAESVLRLESGTYAVRSENGTLRAVTVVGSVGGRVAIEADGIAVGDQVVA